VDGVLPFPLLSPSCLFLEQVTKQLNYTAPTISGGTALFAAFGYADARSLKMMMDRSVRLYALSIDEPKI